MNRPTLPWAAALLLALAASAPCAADGLSGLKDPEDGQLDMSEWLIDRKGFLPVPILITEPAVGYGAGMTALFFRNSMREVAEKGRETGHVTPPDIYAIGGAATENGTWMGFGGGMVSFEEDRYRWRGALLRMSPNLDFWGPGGRVGPVRYNLDGWSSVQHGMVRLGQTSTWLVARWNYLDLQNRFDNEGETAQFGPIVRKDRASGLGLSLEIDTRDNFFTPTRGVNGSLEGTWYAPGWGSDTTFQTYRLHVFSYWPVAKSLVLGGRFDVRAANGEVPFFMLPYVDLRGVPAMRLQDRRTGVLEAEATWHMTPRWALVGFVGGGRAWGTATSYSEGNDTVAKGVGFRYLIARRLGMYMGVDWAWSTQDHAFYIQVGSAWR